MKTQVKLLDSAKQGNLDALVALINQPLEHRQIVASASLHRRCLTITAEAPHEPPGRLFFVDFVRQGINTLRPRGVERVIVQGKKCRDSAIAWHDQFKVDSPNLADSSLELEPLSLKTHSPSPEAAENLFSGHGQTNAGNPRAGATSKNPGQTSRDAPDAQDAPGAQDAPDAKAALPATEPAQTEPAQTEPAVNRPRRRRPAAKVQTQSPQQVQLAAGLAPSVPRLMNHAFGFLWASSFMLGCLLTVSVAGWFMPQRMARTEWEYRIVSIADDDFNLAIQELGEEGWELAYARRAIAEENAVEYSLYEIILKRPKSFLD